jgi:hypothetical protein
MQTKFFHGDIYPSDIANALLANFNRSNLEARGAEFENQMIIQIRTRAFRSSGGDTALSVFLRRIEDGISVQIGSQAWLGLAASLGVSALSALINPIHLINRLDDIAQDVESLQLQDEVIKVIESTARSLGAASELSKILRRITCAYCLSANPVGEATCIACGAPLGDRQPNTCKTCGFVLYEKLIVCPNCGSKC